MIHKKLIIEVILIKNLGIKIKSDSQGVLFKRSKLSKNGLNAR